MIALPVVGSKLVCAHAYALSHFGNTYRIVAKLPDGSEAKYFLKTVADKRSGQAILQGEYEGARAIHAMIPSLVPKVHAVGALPSSRSHFLLSEFRTVAKQPPAAGPLVKQIAKLHQESRSPTGKFGFHVPTYWGSMEQSVEWEESWRVAFSSILQNFLDLSNEVHGTTPEFEAARALLFERVIPRLLDPLQAQGRILKPSLIHGDLWEGNCAEDEHGQPFIFDCSSSYAHNEMEIAFWTPPRNLMAAGGFVEAYKKLVPPSAPGELSRAISFTFAHLQYRGGLGSATQVVYTAMERLSVRHHSKQWAKTSVGWSKHELAEPANDH